MNSSSHHHLAIPGKPSSAPENNMRESMSSRVSSSASSLIKGSLFHTNLNDVASTIASISEGRSKEGSTSASSSDLRRSVSSQNRKDSGALMHHEVNHSAPSASQDAFRSQRVRETNITDKLDLDPDECLLEKVPDHSFQQSCLGKECKFVKEGKLPFLSPQEPVMAQSSYEPQNSSRSASCTLPSIDKFSDFFPSPSEELDDIKHLNDQDTPCETLPAGPQPTLNSVIQITLLNPLSLLPQFDNMLKASHPQTISFNDRKRQSEEPGNDMSPWLNMLHTYQNEVWGDMVCAIPEERSKIKETRQSSWEKGSAAKRLAMLMRHIGVTG